jgi:hypothetical protein
MKTKHTPGPWYETGPYVQSAAINEDNYVCRAEGDNPKQIEANAHLIAAAPDLLAELQDIAAFVDSAIQQDILNGVECFPMMERIRAALTKATT